MKNQFILVMTFMCSALFGGTAAIAQDMRIPAHVCQIIANGERSQMHIVSSNESRARIVCPILDSSVLRQGSFNRFNLHYFDNHDGQSVQAQPCVTFFNAFGGTCAGLFQENQDRFTGTGALSYPFFTLWRDRPFDFAYINIRLTQQDCGGIFDFTCSVSFFYGAFAFHSVSAAESPEVSSPLAAETDGTALIQEFEERIAAHTTEQLDSAWAAKTSNRIYQTLEALQQEGGFTLIDVDCRSRTCLAQIQWKNFSAAVQNFNKLLTADFGTSLSTEIVIRSTPIDLSEQYEEIMYFRRDR